MNLQMRYELDCAENALGDTLIYESIISMRLCIEA